ncbi:MAG: adenylate/guanylate cyclase domain-containing protein [Campylobacterota bacterium]|nr:adenylate/guanylate cyclase domain-containing protein [Campylobacterota bacterium]
MSMKDKDYLEHIEELLLQESDLNNDKDLVQQLVKEHKKTIRQLNKILKISDKVQDEVNRKNKLLEDLSHKLSFYLSPQIYESIFLGKQDVSLQSGRKKLTIFFSDLVNFTQTTENLQPEVLSDILNNYLDEMVTIALKHGATIDKFIGDAIMLFFGDPETQGEHQDALRCVTMAIEMREKIKELAPQWMDKGLLEPFKVRMGVATGYVTVGNFGSKHRMDYTIIGGHVNLASRLEESANPNTILISHETYSLIKDDILCEAKEKVLVKGIPYPIPTYEVIDLYKNLKQKNEINISKKEMTLYINKDSISQENQLDTIKALQKAIDEIESLNIK